MDPEVVAMVTCGEAHEVHGLDREEDAYDEIEGSEFQALWHIGPAHRIWALNELLLISKSQHVVATRLSSLCSQVKDTHISFIQVATFLPLCPIKKAPSSQIHIEHNYNNCINCKVWYTLITPTPPASQQVSGISCSGCGEQLRGGLVFLGGSRRVNHQRLSQGMSDFQGLLCHGVSFGNTVACGALRHKANIPFFA